MKCLLQTGRASRRYQSSLKQNFYIEYCIAGRTALKELGEARCCRVDHYTISNNESDCKSESAHAILRGESKGNVE
jgi:hypothetical protein